MEILFALITLSLLLGFFLKISFYTRRGVAAVALAAGCLVRLALPWLMTLSGSEVESWLAGAAGMGEWSVVVVVGALLSAAFCFTHPSGRFRPLFYYPGLSALLAICLAWAQLPFGRPGIDFARFTYLATAVTPLLIYGGGRLMRRLLPGEDERLEGLFITDILLILLTVAATGALTL